MHSNLYLVISLNANVKPSVEEIKIILQKYGSVEIKSRKHNYQISGKKNKNKNVELIAIIKF